MLPAKTKKLSPKGSKSDEVSAASINNPSIRAADTSIIPVKIDANPDKAKTEKLPDRLHLKKPNKFWGGQPFGVAMSLIQSDGRILQSSLISFHNLYVSSQMGSNKTSMRFKNNLCVI